MQPKSVNRSVSQSVGQSMLQLLLCLIQCTFSISSVRLSVLKQINITLTSYVHQHQVSSTVSSSSAASYLLAGSWTWYCAGHFKSYFKSV